MATIMRMLEEGERPDATQLEYERVKRPIFPLEPNTPWTPPPKALKLEINKDPVEREQNR